MNSYITECGHRHEVPETMVDDQTVVGSLPKN